MGETSDIRYAPDRLRQFAQALFAAAGLEEEKADAVAHYLLEADLMGHTTHGLALAGWYLQSIADGVMKREGLPEVVSDRGPAIAWQGRRLPGAWLTSEAVKLACERAATYGTSTIAIADSHHIGCLATYLTIATDRGYMVASRVPAHQGRTSLRSGDERASTRRTPSPMAFRRPAIRS